MKSGAMPCENIANKYGVTVPQLFLKWAIQLGYLFYQNLSNMID